MIMIACATLALHSLYRPEFPLFLDGDELMMAAKRLFTRHYIS